MLGLWGTSNLKRVAVSVELHTPETVLGYVREVDELKWVAEGDPGNLRFNTPREAAEYGYATLWRADPGPRHERSGDPEEAEQVRSSLEQR